jgi:hypothetical protein
MEAVEDAMISMLRDKVTAPSLAALAAASAHAYRHVCMNEPTTRVITPLDVNSKLKRPERIRRATDKMPTAVEQLERIRHSNLNNSCIAWRFAP